MTNMQSMWDYKDTKPSGTTDLVGFEVEGTDGRIGKIDEATYDVGASYLVVDTGFWILGKKRTLPAGVVERMDFDDRKVFVKLTKEQIREAPDFEAGLQRDETYRQNVGRHYGPYVRN